MSVIWKIKYRLSWMLICKAEWMKLQEYVKELLISMPPKKDLDFNRSFAWVKICQDRTLIFLKAVSPEGCFKICAEQQHRMRSWSKTHWNQRRYSHYSKDDYRVMYRKISGIIPSAFTGKHSAVSIIVDGNHYDYSSKNNSSS